MLLLCVCGQNDYTTREAAVPSYNATRIPTDEQQHISASANLCSTQIHITCVNQTKIRLIPGNVASRLCNVVIWATVHWISYNENKPDSQNKLGLTC